MRWEGPFRRQSSTLPWRLIESRPGPAPRKTGCHRDLPTPRSRRRADTSRDNEWPDLDEPLSLSFPIVGVEVEVQPAPACAFLRDAVQGHNRTDSHLSGLSKHIRRIDARGTGSREA